MKRIIMVVLILLMAVPAVAGDTTDTGDNFWWGIIARADEIWADICDINFTCDAPLYNWLKK